MPIINITQQVNIFSVVNLPIILIFTIKCNLFNINTYYVCMYDVCMYDVESINFDNKVTPIHHNLMV